MLALGIILLVGGAVARFAVTDTLDNVDLEVLGNIGMAAGALALVIAAIQGAGFMSMGNKKYRSERHVSPDGNSVVEETQVR